MQGADLLVELVTALVEAAQVLRQGGGDELAGHRRKAGRAGGGDDDLEGVEQPARVAVGPADQAGGGIRIEGRRGGMGGGTCQQQSHVGLAKWLQHVNRRARQQGAVDLE